METNRIEVRCFTDGTSQIWVKDSVGRMVISLEYISQKQLNEVRRDYHAYIEIDERENL